MSISQRVATALVTILVASIGGCRSDRPAAVPRDAVLFSDWKSGQKIAPHLTAPSDGIVYVADTWDNTLVASIPVHAGDRVQLDRDAGRVTVNDRIVYEKPMRQTEHLLFFKATQS